MSELSTERRPLQFDGTKVDWGELMQEALDLPGELGNTYNRFYPYSFFNQIALRLQGVTEPVATYKKWQELNRQVLKGSRAKSILRPIIVNAENDKGEVERKLRGYKWTRCLFMYSETEGEELPPYEPPEWSRERALASLAIQEVPYTNLVANAQGYSINREIAISPLAPYPLKTTIHEMGHVVLKHTVDEPDNPYPHARGIGEFQAEATAYLVMNELDARDQMNPSESRAYIAGHLGDDRPDDAQIRQVFTATDAILKAGRAEPKEIGDE